MCFYLKSFVLIYETFVQFEVVLTNYFMKTKGEIITVGLDDREVTSWEGFKTVPHVAIDEVDPEVVDLFVIPGGEPDKLFESVKLLNLIKELYEQGKMLAAICAAPLQLARADLLNDHRYTTTLPLDEFDSFSQDNFQNDNVVVDRNIITAKAAGYVDFALEIGKKMDIFADEEDYQETVEYFKYYNQK